jgi:hypothetical protein
MAKTLRIELTLADVAMVLEKQYPIEVPAELEADCKVAMASTAYRAGASKAFKGVKDRAALPYENRVNRLTMGLGEVGLAIISHEPYVAPEKAEFGKKAAALLATAKEKNRTEYLAEQIGYEGDTTDEAEFLKAIHEWLKNPIKL